LVVDGSVDNTREVIEKYTSKGFNIHVEYFDFNLGQPIAYNTCMRNARDVFGAKYVLMSNDDMVFGPFWDQGLEKYTTDIQKGLLLSLYYAWPGPWGYGAVSYEEGGSDPHTFDLAKWEQFCRNYVHPKDLVGKTGFGPGFPFIISTDLIDTYHFDEEFHTGGVLDTDFLLTLFLDGYPMERLGQNLFFHFSGGATDKQKAQGIWIEHGDTFINKWGISVEKAQWAITGKQPFSESTLSSLKKLQDKYRFNKI